MTTFRQWLVEKVRATAHAREPLPPEQLPFKAFELGVHPSVLEEARSEYLEEAARGGVLVGSGRKRRGSRHWQVKLHFPREVFVAWKEEASVRGLEGSTILRSLLHAYLLGSHEPYPLLNYWLWKGRRRLIGKSQSGTAAFTERALATHGARRALERRAQRLGCSPSAVLRGLVIETLERRYAQPGSIAIVDARTMFDDEARYYLGD